MDHREERKAERVHRDEAIQQLEGPVVVVERSVDGQRQSAPLDLSVERHVRIVMDGSIADAGDEEADDAGPVAELADETQAVGRALERQGNHVLYVWVAL